MYGSHWEDVLRVEAQRRAFARAQAQARVEAESRVNSLNDAAARAKSTPWEVHARSFEEFRQRQEEEADEQAKRRAEQQWQEFNARLHGYKGELDPLFEVLKIKSKNPTKAEVRSAYIASIRRVHPDLGGSEDEAKKVNAAYQLLMKRLG
jgi:hypothetical protein